LFKFDIKGVFTKKYLLKRVALLVQYDGSNYSGWQRQKNATTVQEILEGALFKITDHE